MSRIVQVLALVGLCPTLYGATLPQAHSWQRALREYLQTLSKASFVVTDHGLRFPDKYSETPTDRIYRDWIVLGNMGREPVTAGFQAEPKHFLLSAIEGEEIRCLPEPAALAWWIQFDYPGNSYAGSQAGMRRALVIAIVDMLMLETAHVDPYTIKPDFMGANLGTWAYTYRVCNGELTEKARAAYREGMLHYFKLMERLAPRDGNSNMDMRELVTLAELDHLFTGDRGFHERAIRLARRILFGATDRGPATSDPRRGTFHPAGYIGEADGPETSYNGISMFHLAEAAMISRGDPDWDAFMPEVIRRMARFRAFNTFPEPGGGYEGPSSWSTRTNDPYTRDQRDRPWRRYAEAMITDAALFRLRIHPDNLRRNNGGHPGRSAMLEDIRKAVVRFNRYPKRPEGWRADDPPTWKERHWPNDLPYTWDGYVRGTHERLAKLVEQRHPSLLAPFERDTNFSESFDEEFWMAKQSDWGFQVEAVPHMSRTYFKGGSGALAGGSLATFWSRKTGVVLLGHLLDKWNKVTWDKVERWPTHHLWGRTKAGTAFSSARQWHPWTRFEPADHPRNVHVFGMLGTWQTVEEEDSLDAGHVYYRRRFELNDDGLHINSEILSRGQDEVSEIWETLPVYLGATKRAAAPFTTIELLVAGKWSLAGEESAPKVTAIRAKRFAGTILIEFDAPHRVVVGPEFETAYQRRCWFRIIHIDLLRGAKKMPIQSGIRYRITADE